MFSRIGSALDKSLEMISKGALLLSGLLLMAMGFNVTYGVIKRYVFVDPSIVAIELVKILMIPALVLAVSYVQRNGRHLRVDFLSNRFPDKVQYVISEIAVPLMGLFVMYVMVWKGWVAAAYSMQINETSYSAWSEPLYPVKIAIPVGYGLLFLVMVGQIVRGVGRLVSGKYKVQPDSDDIIEGG
jgi:TRAP-type C4-dicarboxylate transport system permease small subunit